MDNCLTGVAADSCDGGGCEKWTRALLLVVTNLLMVMMKMRMRAPSAARRAVHQRPAAERLQLRSC